MLSFTKFLLQNIHLYSFLFIVCTTIIIEWSIKKQWLSIFIGRKVLHILAISTCAYVVEHTNNRIYLSYLFLFFGLVLTFLVAKKYFAASQKGSYGIALFPFAFFLLLQATFLLTSQIVFAILVLAFADAAAGLVGYYFGNKKIIFLNEPKTRAGLYAFYIVSFIVYAIYFNFQEWHLGILVALVPALAELFSYKGSDNLTIPIITAIWLFILQTIEPQLIQTNTFYLLGMLVLAVGAFYKKWLSLSGSLAALLIGTLTIFASSILYLIPLALFLASGSLASKLNKKQAEKDGRAAVQVFANGSIAVLCLIIYFITQKEIFAIAYFASIAISMCDTMSSEIGKYFKQPTYDIIGLKKTMVGLSGGISMAGTLAGIFFCMLYSIAIYLTFFIPYTSIIIIFLIGISGMLLDSVLGSIIQAKYQLNNTITETKTEQKIKGYHWCTNDMVNILSNLITISLFIAIQFV